MAAVAEAAEAVSDVTATVAGRMSGEARRRQLICVAIDLFSKKGFTGTTTKEIAHAAGVNEAMIFRHFATKDDLYAAILDFKANEVCSTDWIAELRTFAARRDDEGLFRTIATKKLMHHRHDTGDQFMRLMFYSALEGHGLARLFLERQARPMHDFLCAYIRQRQREGAFRQVHSSIAVNAFIGALNHHVMTNVFFSEWRVDVSDKEAIRSFTHLLLDGLRRTRAPQNNCQKLKTKNVAKTFDAKKNETSRHKNKTSKAS